MTLAVVFSGAAGLIFQIAWLYECSLVFGNSLWSATIVLSSFMGGLALGNALVVRFSRRLDRPFIAYATLEAAVGVSGVLLTYALPHLTSVVAPLTNAAGANLALVNLTRLIAAFAVLVIPATAMGATLPVLVGALSRDDRSFGGVLGHFYGWNTFGAVAGVVAAELVLVRSVGIRGSGWAAALLDFLAAAIALRALPAAPRPEMGSPAARKPSGGYGFGNVPWALLVSAGLAGAVLLSLEVVWFRFLTMYVLSTTLTVSLMLASVLAAIAAGGLVASAWLKRRADASSYAAPVALLAGCATVVSYAAFGFLTSGTQVAASGRVLWMACALTAPTSFLSGMLFTLLGDALERAMPAAPGGGHQRDDGRRTRAVAALTLANTAGAMCGPPVAAFVLLPAIGMEGAFFALALAYLTVAAAAFRAADRRAAWPRATALAVIGVAFVLAIIQFPFGAMRNRYFLRAADAYSGDGSAIVATREGASDTVFLMQQAWLGRPVYDRLVTDGFSMSGTAIPGQRYMRAFAYWPMLLHEGPLKHALVVCYGVGVTAQAVEDIASLDAIDVVEISSDVVGMSDVIYQGAKPPLHDPRVRLHLEDGRNFLQTTGERFDLITGEPPPPRTPGTVNIYTREYFQLIHDRLAEGGMTTYWVPVARPSPGTDVDTIIRAFCDVFDDCSLWNTTPFDFMLVGTKHAPGPVSTDAFTRPWVTPGLEARLREVGFEEPREIGATFLGDAAYLRELTRNTPPLVDDFPQRLLPSPSRPSLSDPHYASDPAVAGYFQRVLDPARAKALFLSSPAIRRLLPESVIAQTPAAFEYQRIINRVLWEGGKPLRQIEDLHWLLTETRLRTLPLWVLGSDDVKQGIAEASGDTSGAVEYARGLRALTGRGYATAAQYLAQAEQHGLENSQVRGLRAYALLMAGQVEQARSLMPPSRPADPDEAHFWEWIRTRIASGASAS
jgi:predicted membrane-bound spermidine synthase